MLLHRIPESRFADFQLETPVTLLLEGPGSFTSWLAEPLDPRIVCFETDALPENGEALPDPVIQENGSVPGIDYRILDPAADFPTLYQLAQLAPNFPVRVRIATRPGAEKALKLAQALQIESLLLLEQPDRATLKLLADLLDRFLHGEDYEVAVEPFTSLLAAYIHQQPLNLWDIPEHNPVTTVEMDLDGQLHPPGRVAHLRDEPSEIFRDQFPDRAADHVECRICPHRERCQGFFKWPDPTYDCTLLRQQLLDPIVQAAQDLHVVLQESDPPSSP